MAAAVLSLFGVASSTPAEQEIAAAQPCATISRTLSLGSRGDEVKKVQVVLGVEQTGYFGSITRQKLTDWQLAKKIILTAKAEGAGTMGPKTRAALKCGAAVIPSAPTIPQQSKATQTATTSFATSTTPASIPTAQPAPSGGGGVSVPTVSPYGYSCSALGAKPAASSCAGGTWELSADEAGCIIWACLSNDDRG